MTSFNKKYHVEINENFQGINLTEFSIVVDNSIDNEGVISKFIRTKCFAVDSLRDCIKKKPDKDYLKSAFNFNKIKIEDFRKFDKDNLYKFLSDFLNDSDWGEDKTDFAKLLSRYMEMQKALNEIDYYIISKDWFSKDDNRLIEPESWAYAYYFLIISIDSSLNSLMLAEWSYD